MRTYIIAEAGVNHNGAFETAKKMVRVAKECGVDAVKFQTFVSESIVSKIATKAEYQMNNINDGTDSQLNMLKKLELSYNEFEKLKFYCNEIGIQFISTPFDLQSIAFLDELKIPFWKVPSGEVTNVPYLIAIARTKKPVIMSTGMCTIEEVEFAINLLKENGTKEISLLHCNTEYPTPYRDVNLNAMKTLKDKFECRVGYSDHTLGIEVPIAAAAMGAQIIEKHFTLDKSMEGPDHKASLEPDELKKMVSAIRNIEISMGSDKKEPSESEIKNMEIARKSIVASREIRKGETFTTDNITTKRPGSGINPIKWFEVLGQKAIKNFEEDELITLE